ncbi:MAG: hypothetical protein J1F63_07320 [Oscillospiraceae bacterium]|nr:hypothetical protein [Oscillospiraceae bacterium]
MKKLIIFLLASVLLLPASAFAEGSPYLDDLRGLLSSEVNVWSHNEIMTVTTPEYQLTADVRVNADGEARRMAGTVSVTAGGLTENGSLELIVSRKALYFKTDIIRMLPNLPAAYAVGIAPDRWYAADWGELEEYISGADRGVLRSVAAGLIDGGTDAAGLETLISEGNAKAMNRAFSNMVIVSRPDGSSELRLNISAEDMEALTGEAVEVSHEATWRGGSVESANTAIVLQDGTKYASEITGGQALFAEKVELPADTVNFVDVLHTVKRNMGA